jgi:hypothetical protein
MLTLALAVLAVQNGVAPLASIEDVASLPPARVRAEAKQLIIELPPVDLPAADARGEGMVRLAAHRVEIPMSGYIHRYEVVVVDTSGARLPQTMLHHFNLDDPYRRELFAPLRLHLLAASKETPPPSVPWLVFGMPFAEGHRYIATAMLANADLAPRNGVIVRLVLDYVPAGRPWPFITGLPWVMDVRFPLGGEGGSLAFDLPPGRSEHYWESRPALEGTLLGMGGHAHDFAVALEFKDMTTGEVIWRVEPERDSAGRVLEVPLGRFYRWYRLGIKVYPDHVYRATVTYVNPTDRVLRNAGMGAVAGVIVPDNLAEWPVADFDDPIYRTDLTNLIRPALAVMHGHH